MRFVQNQQGYLETSMSDDTEVAKTRMRNETKVANAPLGSEPAASNDTKREDEPSTTGSRVLWIICMIFILGTFASIYIAHSLKDM